MRHVLCLLVLGLAISSASAGTLSPEDQAYYRGLTGGWLFGWAAQVNQVAGGWEYYIDFYTNGVNEGWGYWIGGFDPSGVQNFEDPTDIYVRDAWSYRDWGPNAIVTMPESVHVYEDYGTDGWSRYLTATHDGTAYGGPPDGVVHTDRMWMYNWGGGAGGMNPGLLMTWRFVFDQQYFDGDLWVATSWTDPLPIFNLPIDAGTPGDFDGENGVNADDIDILCENMGSLDPTYDLDDGSGDGIPDGVVDEDDMIYHVEKLVELQDGSGRLGTKRGDFNLDGFVDGTDLALMKTAFGQPGQNYADGNANCDAFVDGTDLAILKTNFGFIATTGGGVPEPMTIGLLSLGGLALIRQRRK
ncbi:MAG TPA: PEP-CTERM sorting domain-containing protein [Phycisphaerae bacterium]|nr:PEP-CTERM sorting domain-containing protein [Phycisphaerae bacterium]